MVILISALISLLIEAVLVAWTGHVTYWWLSSLGSCELAPSSMNLKYCGSFWTIVAPWLAACLLIPSGWLVRMLRQRNR